MFRNFKDRAERPSAGGEAPLIVERRTSSLYMKKPPKA